MKWYRAGQKTLLPGPLKVTCALASKWGQYLPAAIRVDLTPEKITSELISSILFRGAVFHKSYLQLSKILYTPLIIQIYAPFMLF